MRESGIWSMGKAQRSKLISVTQDDIERGVRGDCSACPVAYALERALGGKWAVSTDLAMEAGESNKTVRLLAMPDSVADFVVAFDLNQPVTPFEFKVAWDA